MEILRRNGPMGTSAPTGMQRKDGFCKQRAGVVAPYGCNVDSAYRPFGLRAHNVRPYGIGGGPKFCNPGSSHRVIR